MIHIGKVIFTFSVCVFFLLVCVEAVTTTGGIEGDITGVDGNAVVGAAVTVSGPRMMGSHTVTTDERGHFRILMVPPGTYKLNITAPGFADWQVDDVAVNLDSTTFIDPVQLPLPPEIDEITVVAATDTIDLTSTAVGGNINEAVFTKLPVPRAYQNIAALLPGVSLEMASYDPDRLRDTPTISGSSGPENNYVVDGMTTTDPLLGINGTKLTFNFIEEMQVMTAGFQAEYGRSTGGIINVITKSGGNEYHGDLFLYFNNYDMNGEGTWKSSRGVDTDWVGSNYLDYGLDVGGYLMKDKVWFFLAYNRSYEEEKVEGFFGQDMKSERRYDYYAAKVTWNVTPAHRLILSAFGDPGEHDRYFTGSIGNGSPASYELIEETGGTNTVLKYSGLYANEQLLVDATLGRHHQIVNWTPKNGDDQSPYEEYSWSDPAAHGDSNPLHKDGYQDGGLTFLLDFDTTRDIIDLKGTYYLSDHKFKMGYQYDYTYNDNSSETFSGGTRYLYYEDYVITWNSLKQSDATSTSQAFFLQDTWQVNPHVYLYGGLRFEQQVITNDAGNTAMDLGSWTDFSDGWSPRIGIAYDLGADKSSKIFASFGRYYELIPVYLSVIAFGDKEVSVYLTDYGPDNVPFSGDESDPVTIFYSDEESAVAEGIKGQYLDEFCAGIEWSLKKDYKIGVTGMYRDIKRVIEDVTVYDGDESFYMFAHPGQGPASDYPEAKRTYYSLELTLQRYYADRYQFDASYMWSRLTGNYDGYYLPNRPQVAPNVSGGYDYIEYTYNSDGALYEDRPHRFKFNGSYVFDFGLTVGSVFQLISGRPINALGWDNYHQNGDGLIFTSERGSEGRTPMTWTWDLHLEYQPTLFENLKAAVILDIFNVTNNNEIVDVDDNRYREEDSRPKLPPHAVENPYWKDGTRYQTPRLIRLGFKLSW
ncbi:carboxypeptidase regulatory-like domain-containing protein [candidate division CSSED10-310 bacterium]|uniref:Carboxypeptidase regulatory-like domain-containing protein n=1 Tax=candidate division CSSED10-310 bacterium TaxID=2855610 RepID=A0ABV6YZD2_UNCC1